MRLRSSASHRRLVGSWVHEGLLLIRAGLAVAAQLLAAAPSAQSRSYAAIVAVDLLGARRFLIHEGLRTRATARRSCFATGESRSCSFHDGLLRRVATLQRFRTKFFSERSDQHRGGGSPLLRNGRVTYGRFLINTFRTHPLVPWLVVSNS